MNEVTWTDDSHSAGPANKEITWGEEEAQGLKPVDQRGALDNTENEGWISGGAKNVGTAAIKGLAHIPGFGGDIRNLADMIIAGLQTGAGYVDGDPRTFQEHMDANAQREAQINAMRPWWAKFPHPPSGADISNPILSQTGEYKPETLGGKLTAAGIEGGLGALGPGSLGAAKEGITGAQLVKEALHQVPGAVVGSMAGEGAGQIDPSLALPAAILAGGATNVATTGARALSGMRSEEAAAERARQIAGQVARESATDPDAAQKALAAANRRNTSVKGADHTSAEVAQDAGIGALERRMMSESSKDGGEDNQLLAAQQQKTQNAVNAAAENAADTLDKKTKVGDVKGSYGISGNDPMTNASTSARSIYSAAEKAASDATDQAWEAADTAGTNLYKRRSLASLRDAVDSLRSDPVYGDTVPNWIDGAIDNIDASSTKNGQISLKTIQDLRSRALSEKRVLDSAMNPDQAKQAKAAALSRVADAAKGVLSDEQNYAFKDADARDAWQNAVDATRKYHETFNAGDLGLLNDPDHAIPTVAPEATIGKLLAGKNGIQNLQLFRKAVGTSADPVIGDYVVGKLTNNGEKVVTQNDVNAFMAKQDNAQILNEVPGLRDRLMGIAQRAGETEAQGAQRQLVDNFQTVVGKNDPAALVRFLDKNGDDLRAIHPNPKFIDALENSARRISDMPSGSMAGKETMDALSKGRIFDILYGKATGKIADTVAGGVAGSTLGAVGVPPGAAEAVGALAGATGVGGKGLKGAISAGVNNLFFGSTKEQAMGLLQQAMRDPKLLNELMKEPTPERVNLLLQMTKGAASAAGRGALVPAEVTASDQEQRKAEGGPVDDKPDYKAQFLKLMDESPDQALELVHRYREDVLAQHPHLKDKIDLIERSVRRKQADFAKGGSVANDPFHERLANALVQKALEANPPRFAGGKAVIVEDIVKGVKNALAKAAERGEQGASSDVIKQLKEGRGAPELAERYPLTAPPELRFDKNKGTEYLGKVSSPEADAVSAARSAAQKDIDAGRYDPFFKVEDRADVDPNNHPMSVNTLAITPVKDATIQKNTDAIRTKEAADRLNRLYDVGAGQPGALNWYYMKQLEDEYVKAHGPEEGRRLFADRFAVPMAATTGGADPTANLMMAHYGNWMRDRGQPIPATYDMPFPIGGRYVGGNMDMYNRVLNEGDALDARNPKRYNFSANFLGHPDRATIDEVMSGAIKPGMAMPPSGNYGIWEKFIHDLAGDRGIDPRQYQEVVWSGAKTSEPGKKSYTPKPMIQITNEAIERTSRITGKSPDEVVQGLVSGNMPLYKKGGLAQVAGR